MRQASRITLFVQDRDGKLDAFPDLEVLHALMRQVPLVNRNPDGSRTLVFDLPEPAAILGADPRWAEMQAERLRTKINAVANEARGLGLSLTASLAEAAELVIESELAAMVPPRPQA
jgi:hypothetical protein